MSGKSTPPAIAADARCDELQRIPCVAVVLRLVHVHMLYRARSATPEARGAYHGEGTPDVRRPITRRRLTGGNRDKSGLGEAAAAMQLSEARMVLHRNYATPVCEKDQGYNWFEGRQRPIDLGVSSLSMCVQ